jgi:hypothetical protein
MFVVVVLVDVIVLLILDTSDIILKQKQQSVGNQNEDTLNFKHVENNSICMLNII